MDRAGHGYDRWAELVAQAGYCHHPIRLAGRVEHADRHTRGPTGVRLGAGAGRGAAEGVRHPAGVPLPIVRGHLPGRRLPAPRRRPQGRQGRPRDGQPASAVVRDLHRPQLRPGPHPQGPGAPGAALPPVPAGCPLPHGLRDGCWHRHDEDDPRLGEPLCPSCYDAQAQVLWNALAPELWRRTTIALQRALGRLVGLQEGELRRLVRVSYAKVAEFQRRGAIHFHAVIRLDAATDCRCPACLAPPPERFTAASSRTPSPGRPDRAGALPARRWWPGAVCPVGRAARRRNITRRRPGGGAVG